MKYRYTLDKDFTYELPEEFQYETLGTIRYADKKNKTWLILDGKTIKVLKGYTNDGNTFKFKVFGKVFGTPDGKVMPDGYPQTYYASLCHDALTQFMDDERMIYTREEADKLFYHMLKECKWKWSRLYFWGVRFWSKISFQDV